MNARRFDHPDAAAMASAVADAVADTIRSAIEARGVAVIGVAGGSTPASAALLFARPLDWRLVTLVCTDERWVDVDDPLSNFARLRQWTARTPAQAAGLVPLVAHPRELIADAAAADGRIAALGRFDLVWAGMGADGHALSWFPGPDLAAALDPANPRGVIAVRPDPLPSEAAVARLTLTLSAAARARQIIVTATGSPKKAILDDPAGFPVASLLSLGPAVHWAPTP